MSSSVTYPHRIRITRGTGSPTPGVIDPETGEITPGAPGTAPIIYEGRADVQDAGESIPRSASGMPALASDATVFLQDERAGLAIEPNDTIEVFYPTDDRTAEGEVKFYREMDGVVLIVFR